MNFNNIIIIITLPNIYLKPFYIDERREYIKEIRICWLFVCFKISFDRILIDDHKPEKHFFGYW